MDPALLVVALCDCYTPKIRWGVMEFGNSDNATGAANQQERLDAYIAGFVDGEGSFHVAINRTKSTRGSVGNSCLSSESVKT